MPVIVQHHSVITWMTLAEFVQHTIRRMNCAPEAAQVAGDSWNELCRRWRTNSDRYRKLSTGEVQLAIVTGYRRVEVHIEDEDDNGENDMEALR